MSSLWSFWRVLVPLLFVPLCHGTPLSLGSLLQSGIASSKSLPTTTPKTNVTGSFYATCCQPHFDLSSDYRTASSFAIGKFRGAILRASNDYIQKFSVGNLLRSERAFAKSLPVVNSKTKTKAMKNETAILAGGCFWGVEELLRKIPGVITTEVGYTGGATEAPVYTIVKTGTSGHAEAVKIEFDPSKLSFEKLLEHFFKLHDPTTKNQQGNDIGTQYRSAIFYMNEKQKEEGLQMIERVNKSGAWKKPVVTEMVAFKKFYPAEEYHQDYLIKNPNGYTCHYYRDVNF